MTPATPKHTHHRERARAKSTQRKAHSEMTEPTEKKSYKCQSPGCEKMSTLHCPKCIALQLDLAVSAFCSKACFEVAWPTHKNLHARTFAPVFFSLSDCFVSSSCCCHFFFVYYIFFLQRRFSRNTTLSSVRASSSDLLVFTSPVSCGRAMCRRDCRYRQAYLDPSMPTPACRSSRTRSEAARKLTRWTSVGRRR